MYKRIIIQKLATLCFLFLSSVAIADSPYPTQSEFLELAFGGEEYSQQVIWLADEIQNNIESILGHPYPAMRLRYWKAENKTIWILEEIGKDKPITMGFAVKQHEIKLFKVLAFRESRGWEIRIDSFAQQLTGIRLNDDQTLSEHIDGISGATLSVRAVRKLTRLALYLDSMVSSNE